MKLCRSVLALLLGLFGYSTISRAQSACATITGKTTNELPKFSGTVNGVLAMPNGGAKYVYVMTQYGVARGSVANPGNPGPFVLAQIGHKQTQGIDNGGKVDMLCDCWQGGTTIDAAEASDGSARMVSDWNNRGGGLGAEVAVADANNNVAFGQQIDDSTRVLGARVAALYLPTGKFFGYFPFTSSANQGGIAVVDVTSPSGSPNPSSALHPIATLSWGSGTAVVLKAAKVGATLLLVGGVNSEGKIRVAEVDSSSGIPTAKASATTAGTVNSLAIATVNGHTFIFSAEGNSGVQIYEYANGNLTPTAAVTGGNFNEVVVTGGTFPLIFAHNVVSLIGRESYIEVYDTNWLTEGGAIRHAGHVRHTGAPENYIGKGFQALVSGNSAYIYRVQPNTGSGETLVSATTLDISCISIDPSSPPIAGSTLVNLSAAQRQGTERTINYLGDRYQGQDASASSSAPPANGIDQIEWEWKWITGNLFAASPGWSALTYGAALPGGGSTANVNPAYFPCDPSVGGNIQTGDGCAASLGATPAASYQYALRTHNGNGWSTPSVSPPIAVVAPQARIAGLDTSVNPPTLRVLTGQGIADASGSQGNVAEAKFLWVFHPSGGGSTASLAVPSNATAFDLTVTYPGGYTSAISGNVSQVDLVPDFSPTSGPVVVGGSLSITNKMQKASSVSVTLTEYAWDAGAFQALASSFNVANGTASVPAPASGSNHTLKVRYTYLKNGVAQPPVLVTHGPFNVTTSLTVTVTGPASGRTNSTISFTANVVGGAGNPTFTWCFEACSVFPTFTSGPATNSHRFTSAGTYTVVVRATDSGGGTGTGSTSISISGSGGGGTPTPPPSPTPTPPGGGNLAAQLTGPGTGQANNPVTFTAVASGGTPPYTYAWRWGDNALAGYQNGPASNSYTYGAPGTFNVSLRVMDNTGKSVTTSKSVQIANSSGPPAPSAAFDVDGATQNPFNGQLEAEALKPLTFNARELTQNATSFVWDFGDGTAAGSGRSVVHAFAQAGTITVKLTVTGDGTNTVGSTAGTRKFSVKAPQFSAVVVPDAASLVTSDGAWKTDVSVKNGGPTQITITPIFESYDALTSQPSVVDVTTLGFTSATKYVLAPGATWSQTDVVGFLGGSGKGDLLIQSEGGLTPVVAARVYFEASDPATGTFGNAVEPFQIGAFGQVGTSAIRASSPQTIVGVRSDDQLRFKVKLYNSAGSLNGFNLTAFDETGAPVSLKDGGGNPQPSLSFAVRAYQAAELDGDALGLNDPTHRYVLKAEPVTTGSMLLASVSLIDRVTNDSVQLADDATHPSAEGGSVVAFVPGVSRFDTTSAHWRTSVGILNSASAARGVLVEYLYGAGKVAQFFQAMDPGQLLFFNDISELYPGVPEIATETGTSGMLRVTYPADAETTTNPVYVNARSYDDRSQTTGGTAGTALPSYAAADAIAYGDDALVIPGAEQSDRFRTNVGLFAVDGSLTIANVWAVDKDGSAIGSPITIALNQDGISGPWSQFPLSVIPDLPADPVSLRVQVVQGGRVAAYAINVDQKSSDTTFVKGAR